MFANLHLVMPHLYAAGLTLALVWVVVMSRPGVQRLALFLLRGQAVVWCDRVTLLLQAILFTGGAFAIVRWLGTATVLVVLAVPLLWLAILRLRQRPASKTDLTAEHSLPLSTALSETVTPAPKPEPTTGHEHKARQPTAVLALLETTTAVVTAPTTVATPAQLASATAEARPVVTQQPPLNMPPLVPPSKPGPLTHRPKLGKKTVRALL